MCCTVLRRCRRVAPNGAAPLGALTMKGGVLYGTTSAGGATPATAALLRVRHGIFADPPAKGKTAWAFKQLYAFKAGNDGGVPQAGVYIGGTGALYGTTFQFGSTNHNFYCGLVSGLRHCVQVEPARQGQTAWTDTCCTRSTAALMAARVPPACPTAPACCSAPSHSAVSRHVPPKSRRFAAAWCSRFRRSRSRENGRCWTWACR